MSPGWIATAVVFLTLVPGIAAAQHRGEREKSAKAQTEAGRDKGTQAAARGAQTTPAIVEDEPTNLAQLTQEGKSVGPLAGVRQQPVPMPPLDSADLQSLAPVRLYPEVVVPLRGYPLAEPPARQDRPAFAEAAFGLYTTGSFRLGYSGVSWPYDYYVRAEGLSSRGFIDNAGKTALSGAIGGGYIIDEGYGMFSGGHMGADLDYDMQNYRRYAIAEAPERTRNGWQVAASGGNTYGGVTFDARGRYRALTLTDSANAKESSLEGSLQLSTLWKGFKLGGDADLRLTSLSGTSIGYGNVGAYVSYSTSFFTARAGGSIGFADNNDGTSDTKVAPGAELRIYPLPGISIAGAVSGGIAPTSLQTLLQTNPYVSIHPTVKQEIERLGYSVTLRVDASRVFGLRVRAARSTYDNYAYFGLPVEGIFAPLYDNATITKIDGDCFLRLDNANGLVASAIYMETILDETGSQVPYVPKWQVSGSYSHRMSVLPLTLTATARMIGSRTSAAGASWDPVTLVDLEGTYTISGMFDAFVTLQNILDTRYQIWEGYRERGVYGAVGIRTRF